MPQCGADLHLHDQFCLKLAPAARMLTTLGHNSTTSNDPYANAGMQGPIAEIVAKYVTYSDALRTTPLSEDLDLEALSRQLRLGDCGPAPEPLRAATPHAAAVTPGGAGANALPGGDIPINPASSLWRQAASQWQQASCQWNATSRMTPMASVSVPGTPSAFAAARTLGTNWAITQAAHQTGALARRSAYLQSPASLALQQEAPCGAQLAAAAQQLAIASARDDAQPYCTPLPSTGLSSRCPELDAQVEGAAATPARVPMLSSPRLGHADGALDTTVTPVLDLVAAAELQMSPLNSHGQPVQSGVATEVLHIPTDYADGSTAPASGSPAAGQWTAVAGSSTASPELRLDTEQAHTTPRAACAGAAAWPPVDVHERSPASMPLMARSSAPASSGLRHLRSRLRSAGRGRSLNELVTSARRRREQCASIADLLGQVALPCYAFRSHLNTWV
jgi:hypothetical protein